MHPALRILGLVLLALLIQRVSPQILIAVGVGVFALALGCYRQLLMKTLRRSRWLLATLLLIFSFTTPGEYIPGWPFSFSPTYEGVEAGLMQSARLITMLAGLAILLGSTGREALMAGIYALLNMLHVFGVPAERLTARLWLTLDYVEQAPIRATHWWSVMEGANESEHDGGSRSIVLNVPAFTWLDGAITIAFLGTLIWLAR